MSKRTIGVGVIGMGFMGWRHVESYLRAKADGLPCEIVAVCDPMHGSRQGPTNAGNIAPSGRPSALDLERVANYERAEHLLFDPSVRLVSVCTPTDAHVEIALQAIEKGKHVLVEKPVALTAAQVRPLAEAARRARTLCMPAHCMRFWPGWDTLRDAIVRGTYGRVREATFLRAGPIPAWSREFYVDFARSGGALGDFHIHDADFVLWAFGRPARVRCTGSLAQMSTRYDFGRGGPRVSAAAEWATSADAPFRMEHTVVFERATVDFRMGRSPTATVTDESGVHAIALPEGSGYDGEVRSIVGAIADGRSDLRVTMDDALAVAELLDAERRSLETGDWVALDRRSVE